jgi:hypothetical protein
MHEDQASDAALTGSPERAVVPGSRLCLTCGYQLSGLPIDGVCPECSTRVELSLIQLSLLTDPIEHVRTLRRGARRLVVGTVLLVGSPVVMFPFVNVFSTPPGPSLEGLLTAMFIALQFVSVSLMFWGVRSYARTNPDPRVAKMLEWARISVLMNSAVQFGVSLLGTSTLLAVVVSPETDSHFVWGVLFFGGIIAWFFQVWSVITYTGKLAARVPDLWLVKRAKMLRLAIPVLLLLGAITWSAAWLLDMILADVPYALAWRITWGLASLVGVILYLFVLERMHWHLKGIITVRASRGF